MISLNSPPINDPVSEPYIVSASTASTESYTLSQQLLFLQEILLEFQRTDSVWMSSIQDINMFNEVFHKIAVGEGAQVLPSFTESESLWLQETLLTYEETHPDWRRRLSSFNIMINVSHQVDTNFSTPEPALPPLQGESTNCGMTLPQADPYNL